MAQHLSFWKVHSGLQALLFLTAVRRCSSCVAGMERACWDGKGMPCRTPCQGGVYNALPLESRMTYIQLLKPKDHSSNTSCVVHLAGTGDHGFARRLRLGEPLLQKVPKPIR